VADGAALAPPLLFVVGTAFGADAAGFGVSGAGSTGGTALSANAHHDTDQVTTQKYPSDGDDHPPSI
jgi:hypothetical protein